MKIATILNCTRVSVLIPTEKNTLPGRARRIYIYIYIYYIYTYSSLLRQWVLSSDWIIAHHFLSGRLDLTWLDLTGPKDLSATAPQQRKKPSRRRELRASYIEEVRSSTPRRDVSEDGSCQ